MRVVVTGTPGTGKTSAVKALDTDFEVVHLNDLIRDEDLWEERDTERDSLVADFDAIRERLDGRDGEEDDQNLLVESHLAHNFEADKVVVLRCHPEELERRLTERGENEAKAKENAESEALDVILSEAVAEHGIENVYEIETTDRTPEAVADEIAAVIAGKREPSAGDVEYLDYL
ncbi:adenylate kinase family protein [Halorussus halophilus]|uniref:adenylate kinase family protein n=1 Tax=Halorussus halophilus TaxID=2650975 RepID=UPI0013013173|nr:adenylate kinase family protein [Halorussus halophilus]